MTLVSHDYLYCRRIDPPARLVYSRSMTLHYDYSYRRSHATTMTTISDDYFDYSNDDGDDDCGGAAVGDDDAEYLSNL